MKWKKYGIIYGGVVASVSGGTVTVMAGI